MDISYVHWTFALVLDMYDSVVQGGNVPFLWNESALIALFHKLKRCYNALLSYRSLQIPSIFIVMHLNNGAELMNCMDLCFIAKDFAIETDR